MWGHFPVLFVTLHTALSSALTNPCLPLVTTVLGFSYFTLIRDLDGLVPKGFADHPFLVSNI